MEKYFTSRLIVLFMITYASCASAQSSFLDSAFGSNGIALTHMGSATSGGAFNATVVQPDNKVIAAGAAVGQAIVIRYNENGIIDSSFGINGIYTGPAYSGANALVLQSDGKIVIAGYEASPTLDDDILVIRLNTDGSLDNTFGSSGIVTIRYTAGNDWAYALSLQSDNKIIITGNANEIYITMARLLPNGTPDSTFGTNGLIITANAGQPTGIAVMPDGRIVVGCEDAPVAFMAIRCLANGAPDTSFNHTGVAVSFAGDGGFNYCHAMQLQPDGKIALAGAGTFGAGGSDFTLIRYDTDGTLDRSFGDTGVANIDFNGNDDEAWAMQLLPDGKFIAVGYAIVTSNENFALTRINSDGNIDSSFGNNGRITSQIQSNNDRAYAVTMQQDGKIVAAGYSWIGSYPDDYPELTMARYMAMPSTKVPQVINVPAEYLGLFPNPTTGILSIKGSINHIISITACDIQGNQIPVNTDLPNHKVYISNVAADLYFFKISYNDHPPDVQKIIIEN